MRKLATAVGLATALLIIPAAAEATPPSPASGTETITSETATVVGTADGNTILAVTAAAVIGGSFSGTFAAQFTTIIHPSGQINDVGTGVCTCSFEGRSGTVTFHFAGTGTASDVEVQATTIGATGGLQGLHSKLAVNVAGTAVTYSGTAHFGP